MAFDGVTASNYFYTDQLDHGIGTGDFTFAAWIYPTSLAMGTGIWSNGGYNENCSFMTNWTSGKITVYSNDGSYPFDSVLTLNAWSHVVLRRLSASVSVWVNGTKDATEWTTYNLPVISLSNRFQYIGVAHAVGLMNIAEAGLWAAGLDSMEIKALAKGFSPDHFRLASLRAYWDLTRDGRDKWESKVQPTFTSAAAFVSHPRVIYPQSTWCGSYTAAADGVPFYNRRFNQTLKCR